MRILGVSKKWDKLRLPFWTTFRFARKDKDWYKGEVVEVVYKPRSKERAVLGQAQLTDVDPRQFGVHTIGSRFYISNTEAQIDGFKNYAKMVIWFRAQYGDRIFSEPMNKITVEWLAKDGRSRR